VITADDVDTLLFDVLGTVVDEAGSMRAELANALDQAGLGREQAEELAAAWARRFETLVASIGQGAPWQSTDELNARALTDVLRDGPPLPDAAVRHLALAGHRLRPWPDAVAAHPWDLRAAAAHGLRTAYIERAGEGEPEPSDRFDLTAPDLAALAERLLTGA
jgi:2-haloacid dehalogenase